MKGRRMQARELIAILQQLDPETSVYLYNPDAPQACHVKSLLTVTLLQKHEQLDPQCYGMDKGNPKLSWLWHKQAVLVSAAHQSVCRLGGTSVLSSTS